MKKIKTLIVFIFLILLIHNSFLIRISLMLTGRPNAIPYGAVFILAISSIMIFLYKNNNINYHKFIYSMLLSFFAISIGLIKLYSDTDYSLGEAIVFRFSFYFLFFIFLPLEKLSLDYRLFRNLSYFYISINLVLGLLQAFFNKTFILTEFNQIPFVNSVFYKDGFSTSYSYLLDYGGKVRSFAFFDSGLTFGLFILFFFSVLVYKIPKNKKSFNYIGMLLCILGIYFSRTRNVYIVSLFFLILFIFLKIFKNRMNIKRIFFIELIVLNLITFLYTSIFNETTLTRFFKFDFSSLLSRRMLFQEALSNLRGIGDYLFGFGKLNVITIDNDVLYIINMAGIIFFLIILGIYVYSIQQALNKPILRNFDKAFVNFMLTYPVAASVNYVSHVYLVICVIYMIYLKTNNEMSK